MDREEYDLGGRRDSSYFLSDFKAVHEGKGEIQNHDVRGQFRNLSKCLFAVSGLPHTSHFGFAASKVRTPMRTTGWSSTISTRLGIKHRQAGAWDLARKNWRCLR
jgi:hypothetical protein